MAIFTVHHGHNESTLFNAECTVGSLTRSISDALLSSCPRAYARLELVPLSFVLDAFAPSGHPRGVSVAFSDAPALAAAPPAKSPSQHFSGAIPFVGLSTRPLETYADAMFGGTASSSSSAAFAALNASPVSGGGGANTTTASSSLAATGTMAAGTPAQSAPNGYVLLGCRHAEHSLPLHVMLQHEHRGAGITPSPQWSSFSATAGNGHAHALSNSRESVRFTTLSVAAAGTAPNANASHALGGIGTRITLDPATAMQRAALMQQAQNVTSLHIAGLTPSHSAGTGARSTSPATAQQPVVSPTPVASLLVQRSGMTPGVDAQENWRAAFGQHFSAILSAPPPSANDPNAHAGTSSAVSAKEGLAEKETNRAELLPPALAGLFPPPHPHITGYDVLWKGTRGEHMRLQDALEEKLICDVEPKKRRGKK